MGAGRDWPGSWAIHRHRFLCRLFEISCGLSLWLHLLNPMQRHTLIVTVSILLGPVEHTKDPEDVAFAPVGAKGVAGAIEAQDKFSISFLIHGYTPRTILIWTIIGTL